ncbi:MAG TPA: hypothetical protein VGP72_16525 [Planctomycetota bacterium]|jgi:hypothetical protein
MTNGNWQKHLKNLGKFCFLNDNAAASVATLNQLRAATLDQLSDDLITSLPLVDSFTSQQNAAFAQAIDSGPTALQNVAKNSAINYLTNAAFIADLTNKPANPVTAATAIAALVAEMTADVVTFTTKSGTGICNFLDMISGTTNAFPQASPGTYPDATYVVLTVL